MCCTHLRLTLFSAITTLQLKTKLWSIVPDTGSYQDRLMHWLIAFRYYYWRKLLKEVDLFVSLYWDVQEKHSVQHACRLNYIHVTVLSKLVPTIYINRWSGRHHMKLKCVVSYENFNRYQMRLPINWIWGSLYSSRAVIWRLGNDHSTLRFMNYSFDYKIMIIPSSISSFQNTANCFTSVKI